MRGHVSDPGGGVGATASAAVRGREAAVTHVVWDCGVAGGLGGHVQASSVRTQPEWSFLLAFDLPGSRAALSDVTVYVTRGRLRPVVTPSLAGCRGLLPRLRANESALQGRLAVAHGVLCRSSRLRAPWVRLEHGRRQTSECL